MENLTVFEFLCKAHLSVIACADDELLQDFLEYLSAVHVAAHEKTIAECNAEEAVRGAWTDGECAVVKGVGCLPSKTKAQIADILNDFNHFAKGCGAHFIVPLGLQKRELRSVFFYILESDKSDIQMFNLHYEDSVLKLECEFGKNAGYYLMYDYDSVTGQLTMREE